MSEKIARLSMTGEGDEPIDVLLVEDSRTVRAQLRRYIALLDRVTLVEAVTLAEARAILEQRAPSLFCVVLDLTLPDAHGLAVVEAVRAYKVPIIVLTGSVDPALRRAVLDLHVIDYMFKSGGAIEDVAYLIGRLRQNHGMQVMVVDDSRTFRTHIRGLLAQYRFPVLEAANGREAMELLETNPEVALVLADYHMPEMNGLEMIKRIRREHRREDLAIIALSDSHQPDLSAAMLKAGANDYLHKGFLIEEFYCRLVQNTNMIRYVRELRELAHCDYLTRLHNRRYLFDAGELLHAEAESNRAHLAVAMVDADHFKRINDIHGHAAGDEALKRIAGVLRRSFRRTDIVSRYGGEEFVCITVLESPDQAHRRFDDLRAAVEALEITWSGRRVPLTVSIGVATGSGKSLQEMIDRADSAVYRAKSEGRNRVAVDAA